MQVAVMNLLAHPDIRSFFVCGDFNQRLTKNGISSDYALRRVVPDRELRGGPFHLNNIGRRSKVVGRSSKTRLEVTP